jgi:hypothetical protein
MGIYGTWFFSLLRVHGGERRLYAEGVKPQKFFSGARAKDGAQLHAP